MKKVWTVNHGHGIKNRPDLAKWFEEQNLIPSVNAKLYAPDAQYYTVVDVYIGTKKDNAGWGYVLYAIEVL